jgi:hypothetical protein
MNRATLDLNELLCTLEQRCILLSYTMHPTELAYTLLTFAASFFWATLLPLNYTAPSEPLSCAALAPYWATVHPAGWATMQPLWATFTLTELRCTLLSYAGPTELRNTMWATLVPIYVFPEMKLLFPKQSYNVLSPSSYTCTSVRDLNISMICLPILLQGNMWTDPGNI